MALMESNGISIDTTKLKSLLNELFARKQDIEGKIFKLVGRQLNLTSVPEVRKVIFQVETALSLYQCSLLIHSMFYYCA